MAPPPLGPPNSSHFADKEFLAVDTSGGASDGNIYSAPVVGPKGEVYVAWFRFAPAPSGIFVAKSTDAGRSFGSPVFVAPLRSIGFTAGQLMGNFRVNSFPRIDVDPNNGNVYIAYAANPSRLDGDAADVFFTRSTNGGATWSVPIRVNDDDTTNDQFLPAVAVNRDGVIEVIWYDRRLDPDNRKIDVFRAQSTDGGLSFGSNERVTSQSFLPAVGYDPTINPLYMGDYIDIKADTAPGGRGSRFLLAWGDCRRILTNPQGSRADQDVVFTSHY